MTKAFTSLGVFCRALVSLLLVALLAFPGDANANPQWPDETSWSPDWAKDLVVYEIAPKTFTSPNGPDSGTFESLRARLPYLQDLGVTAIWLSGFSLSDPHLHFNIWMQYAVIEPDTIDPSLGTPQQFETLIDEAHRRGIRIFLDVVTHGLVSSSPVIARHPEWFRGGTFGMVDFDWDGGHTDLDDWWVKIWTDYVAHYKVDGFRLDLGIHGRPDLWSRIRRNASALGHPIIIFEETPSGVIPGVTDFTEIENTLFSLFPEVGDKETVWTWSAEPRSILANDLPGFYARKFGRLGFFQVDVEYYDGSTVEGHTGKDGELRVTLEGLRDDKVSRRFGDRAGSSEISAMHGAKVPNVPVGDGIPDVQLTVYNIAAKPVRKIKVSDDDGNVWVLEQGTAGALPGSSLFDRPLGMAGQAPTIQLYLSTLSYGSSVTLSIHDVGAGRRYQSDPFTARGSRALFGYSFLFTPMIPLFMSGEEFDASFHPVPWQSPDMFGARDPGTGHMLYGAMLDWSELSQPRHRDMLADVKTMLALRRRYATILTALVRGDVEPPLVAVPYTSDTKVPVPYFRWSGNRGIVVMANRDTGADAHLRLHIPVDKLGGAGDARYRVTDLWNSGKPRVLSATDLAKYMHTIRRDKVRHGGIGLLEVELLDR